MLFIVISSLNWSLNFIVELLNKYRKHKFASLYCHNIEIIEFSLYLSYWALNIIVKVAI